MNRVHPRVMNVSMARQTIFVVLKNLGGYKITGYGPGKRGEEVLISFRITLAIPLTRILCLEPDHNHRKDCRDGRPPIPTFQRIRLPAKR